MRIGYGNLIRADAVALSATSTLAGTAVANLFDRWLHKQWQSAAGTATLTITPIQLAPGVRPRAGLLGLIGTNLGAASVSISVQTALNGTVTYTGSGVGSELWLVLPANDQIIQATIITDAALGRVMLCPVVNAIAYAGDDVVLANDTSTVSKRSRGHQLYWRRKLSFKRVVSRFSFATRAELFGTVSAPESLYALGVSAGRSGEVVCLPSEWLPGGTEPDRIRAHREACYGIALNNMTFSYVDGSGLDEFATDGEPNGDYWSSSLEVIESKRELI